MKHSPYEQRIIDNMAPGALSGEGFLGNDSRPLAEIIEADNANVEDLGVTHEQIAAALEEVLHAAMSHYGTPTVVRNDLRAVYREAMGRIPCPFGGGIVRPKGQVEVTDRDTGRSFTFTPLSVHMIEAHGFYQGHGSPFRLDPPKLVEMLGLEGTET